MCAFIILEKHVVKDGHENKMEHIAIFVSNTTLTISTI